MVKLEIYLRDDYVITVEDYDSVQDVKSGLERKEKFIDIYYARVEVGCITEPTHHCIVNTDNIIFIVETEKE